MQNGPSLPGAEFTITVADENLFTKADNLLPPLQDYNGAYDVYVRDVFTATTELVSKSTAGVIGFIRPMKS